VSVVTVVIVSHNSRGDLERSLPAVLAGERHVIVVDNASTDGTPRLLRERFPDVELVELGENVGYGAACNEGIARASGRFVLLLNPDAWPVEDGIERLVACAERQQRLAAAGPQLRAPDGTPQRSLFAFPTRWWLGRPAITSFPLRAQVSRLPSLRPVPKLLVGAALLVRRDAVKEVGGFDPRFFMFYEEVDLCWRLHESDWSVAFCPDAEFVHVGGTATRRDWPTMYREQLRSHLRFLAKHHGLRYAEHARRVLVVAISVRAVIFWIVRRPDQSSLFRGAAAWLRSNDTRSLLDSV
jgi:GT2 family glycosyltransferase